MSLYDEADERGDWQDDEIWSLGAKPTAAQDAFIGGANAFRVTSNQAVTVNSVGVGYNQQLEIGGASTFTATNGTVLGPNDQGHSYGIDGILYVDADSTFYVGDALVNFGQVNVGSPGFGATAGQITLNGAVAFTGIGVVDLGGETTSAWYAGNITGGDLSNEGNTIEGVGLISLSSLDNAAGTIDAQDISGFSLTISAATFTNSATLEINQQATMDLGLDGATQSMTNTGTINIGYYDGFQNSGADATLAISGNYTINGTGSINFGGDDEHIVSDGTAGDTFTNGAQSSIHADFSGKIGNGDGVTDADNLTFYNYGDVFATDAALAIDTGGNTVYDTGGLLEADDSGNLVIDSPTQMGQYYSLFLGSSPPPGGTIEATSGGTVEINSTVANGPPSKVIAIRQSSGQVVADTGSTVAIQSGGAVAVPIQINGRAGWAPGGVVDLDDGGAITGAITFNGAGGTFNDSSAAAATFDFAGGGGTINFASSGNTADIGGAGGSGDNVTGSGETINETSAEVSVVGGGNTITANRHSSASLSDTNGILDLFHGSYDTVSVSSAEVSVIGRADTITATAGSLVRLANTGTDDDVFTGSDDVLRLNNSETALNGSSNTVHFAGSDSVVANGQSNAFVFGADLGVSSITGFEANERLRLSLDDWTNFAALQASGDLFQSGNNAVIEISATDMLTLVNTQVSELSATNVKFQ